jgi:hypothetical protein
VTVNRSDLPSDRAHNGHGWLSSLLTLKSQKPWCNRYRRAFVSKYSSNFQRQLPYLRIC